MSTLVCFALKEEAAPFHKIAAGRPGVFTLIVGIGRQNAEKSVRDFLDSCRRGGDESQTEIGHQSEPPHVGSCNPDLVLTCGFAGGLNPDLKLGDAVFEIGNRQSAIGNQSEPRHLGCYEKLVAAGAKPAKIHCADRIATTVAEKKTLRDRTGADVVEMESAAIQAVCAEQGIPCVTLRVISDTANEDLPLDFNALSKPDKSLDFGKLAWAVMKSPGKISALMELQKKTSFAARQLADVLGKIISA